MKKSVVNFGESQSIFVILIYGAIRREMIINVAYFTKTEVQPTLAVIIGQAQTITMICVPALVPLCPSLIA